MNLSSEKTSQDNKSVCKRRKVKIADIKRNMLFDTNKSNDDKKRVSQKQLKRQSSFINYGTSIDPKKRIPMLKTFERKDSKMSLPNT